MRQRKVQLLKNFKISSIEGFRIQSVKNEEWKVKSVEIRLKCSHVWIKSEKWRIKSEEFWKVIWNVINFWILIFGLWLFIYAFLLSILPSVSWRLEV
jgi:hypothetical protein